MTTLNTIIEEEKKEFYEQFGGLLEGSDPLDIHKSNLVTFLTIAIQRAYEAGKAETAKMFEEVINTDIERASTSGTPIAVAGRVLVETLRHSELDQDKK